MNNRVLRVYVLESLSTELDPTRTGAHMPVGSEPFTTINLPGGGFGVAVFHDAALTTRVWHPMIIAPMDVPVLPPTIGRDFGRPIGLLPLGGAPAALVPDLPWPTSTLGAVKAAGHG